VQGVSDQPATVEAMGIAVAAGVPVLLWGAPGTGKTSAIRAMADAGGWPCETVIAAIREPSDFSGLPVVVDGVVHFAPPRWAERLAAAGRGLLFLDEISTAPPAVQAALLRVVLERVVGDLTLPDEVVVVAAANPPEQAADGWDLSAPLANRFCHLDWHVDAAAFAQGLVGGWPAAVIPTLAEGWDSGDLHARAQAQVAAFVTVRPALVCAVPTDAAGAGRGWPSPRTWDMAARLLVATEVVGASSQVVTVLLNGALGPGAGTEFLLWRSEMDLPDPEEVLADPARFVVPDRADRAYAALSAVAAAVASRPTVERWLAGWQVVVRVGQATPDVAAVAARTLAQCRPPGAVAPPEVKLFAPMLAEAGLL
jgi:ribosomal protein S11